MRYDALSCTGHRTVGTVHLERIARRGMVLHGHYTPNQICSPSRATMATGLYPRTHGLTRNGMALDEGHATVWARLRAGGLATHAIGKLHYQPLLASMALNMPESLVFWDDAGASAWEGPYFGFDRVELVLGEANESTRAGHYAHWLRRHHPQFVSLYEPQAAGSAQAEDLKEVWRSAVPAPVHYVNWIADRAVAAIDRYAQGAGFCLFVSFPDPHHPFCPPRPYCDLFEPSAMPRPAVVPGELDRMPAYLHDGDDPGQDAYIRPGERVREQGFLLRTDGISEATMQRATAYTSGSVRMIDDAVGRVLDALERQGLAEETFVVFTSDHGELLGDHGLLRKGPPPYRQLLQVPLLMSGPGIVPGRSSHAMTSHLDFMATFASLFGLEPAQTEGLDISGILQGRQQQVRDHLFAEYHPRADARVYNQTVITQDWRYTRYPNEPSWGELFDRHGDPGEHHNRFGEPGMAPVVARLHAMLQAHMPPAPAAGTQVLGAY